jgi:hypothetical protein
MKLLASPSSAIRGRVGFDQRLEIIGGGVANPAVRMDNPLGKVSVMAGGAGRFRKS